MKGVFNIREFPEHTGELLETAGVKTTGRIIAFVVAGKLVQPFTVTVTLYIPVSAKEELGIDGFCCDEVKPFGPCQL